METIYKYQLKIADFQEVDMPEGADVLCVQIHPTPSGTTIQKELPTLWARVDDTKPLVPRRFRIFGTGNPMEYEHELDYIGTVQTHDRAFVWHVYENYIKEQE